jgi:hypothetical protein
VTGLRAESLHMWQDQAATGQKGKLANVNSCGPIPMRLSYFMCIESFDATFNRATSVPVERQVVSSVKAWPHPCHSFTAGSNISSARSGQASGRIKPWSQPPALNLLRGPRLLEQDLGHHLFVFVVKQPTVKYRYAANHRGGEIHDDVHGPAVRHVTVSLQVTTRQ